MIPCVLFEDEHLLAVNKPAGWNTHAPSPYTGEGIYDWLKHREPRWANLAIIHRLDKETSGVIVFGKSPLANRSLTEQFAGRAVRKRYLLLTNRRPKRNELTVKSKLIRIGGRYASGASGEWAETRFEIRNPKSEIGIQSAPIPGPGRADLPVSPDARQRVLTGFMATMPGLSRWSSPHVGDCEVMAEPFTGRTHQIRVHAAESGFPILGDTLYGGPPFLRVCLHAKEISFKYPATGESVTFTAPADFGADARLVLRAAIIEPDATTAFRLIHGASDGWPGWYVDRLGDFLLSQSERPLNEKQQAWLASVGTPVFDPTRTKSSKHAGLEIGAPIRGVYHKSLDRQMRSSDAVRASPKLVSGEASPERFTIRENGVKFELSFNEGYSVGLFLDQRDNRRRLLTGHVAADFPLFQPVIGHRPFEILNTFAYTCGFSVCAALAGAKTISLDLSRKYLEWGKRNFTLNGLDPAQHDFLIGDVFDWLKRLTKKGRAFDVVLLDPPTFSRSKTSGVFRAHNDYGKLVAAALPLLKPGGVLFASTNAADWPPEAFLAQVDEAIHQSGRKIIRQHYAPQPPDFPISRAEPAYLKTVWRRIG